MGIDDLSADSLASVLPGRAVRTYPALLSTEAEAAAWARAGAPPGTVVVADYQASPRGRAGLSWTVEQGKGLGFSLVLRPHLPVEREGWLYTVATSGVADVVGAAAVVEWPDEVLASPGSERAAAVGVTSELGPDGVRWAVVNVIVSATLPPRGPVLARLVAAIEARALQAADAVLNDYRPRCATLGQAVRARLIPLGPAGPEVSGRAANARPDGSLVLETAQGARVAVRPQHLGVLERESVPAQTLVTPIRPPAGGRAPR